MLNKDQKTLRMLFILGLCTKKPESRKKARESFIQVITLKIRKVIFQEPHGKN
jgi:hypothetical protein